MKIIPIFAPTKIRMKQNTLKNTYYFEGKGLHSGKFAHMRVCPAPADTGIRFHRIDLGPDAFVDAIAQNVSLTSRSTTISKGKVSVSTIEHLLSALTGLGVDNALIEIDNVEVPVLDGSAEKYVEAIYPDGLVEQDAPRKYIEIGSEFLYKDDKTGSYIKLIPSDNPSYEVTIDFNSKVLGVQTVKWDPTMDYVHEIAPCRTFCFLHEIQLLASLGLIKGGDVENAIVVVEKPVSPQRIARLAKTFGHPELKVTQQGYLNNVELHFPDECGRHKLLDIIGDLRLVGGFLKAKVIAYKPGHSINTKVAKLI
mgnify:FL=1